MNNIFLKWQTYEVSLFDNEEFIVENIENLTWANSELALTTNPYTAGDNIVNARPMARDIEITIKPTADKGDYSKLVHKLGRLFNKEVTLLWKDREIPANMTVEGEEMPPLITDVQISGIVNEFEAPRFNDSVKIRFNVHCSNPFWQTTEEQEGGASTSSTGIYCPYSEVDCGFSITFLGEFAVQDYDNFYFRFDYENDTIPPWAIEITPRPSGGVYSINSLKLTFTKNAIKMQSGSGVDVAKFFDFSLLRGEFEAPNIWNMKAVNEMPSIPVAAEPFMPFAYFSNNRVNASLTWTPLFL